MVSRVERVSSCLKILRTSHGRAREGVSFETFKEAVYQYEELINLCDSRTLPQHTKEKVANSLFECHIWLDSGCFFLQCELWWLINS